MTSTEDVLLSVCDQVATITLNRPARKNALLHSQIATLAAMVESVRVDDSIRAVVLTGAGEVFCAGGDVKDFAENGGEGHGNEVDSAAVSRQQQQQRIIIGGLRSMAKPVIAALPGAAAGAGVGLALAADLRIGTPRSLFATAFVGVGLSGDFGTSWQLQELIGRARTTELMLLGRRVPAEEALTLGLLNEIVPRADLDDRARQLATTIARGPQIAIRHIKANVSTAEQFPLLDAMDLEVERHKQCGVTDEHRSALAAYLGTS